MAGGSNTPLHPETLTVGFGYDPASVGGAAKPPAFMSSTFTYPSAAVAKELHEAFFDAKETTLTGHIYGRLGHPNLDMLEARLAILDGADEAACFASGMAAASAVFLTQLAPGDVVLHTTPIYGGVDALLHQELVRFGIIPVAITDATSAEAIAEAATLAAGKGRVGLVWAESPANPTAAVADIALLVRAADGIGGREGHRPPVVVDNTFLGPLAQNPIALGADFCLTSLTKYAGGHSDLLAGGLSGSGPAIQRIKSFRTLVGSTLDAHSAWLLLRSFETMHLRTERAASNARAIAGFLRDHPKVAAVTYLGFLAEGSAARAVFDRQCRGTGSTFSFKIRGGEKEAFRLLDALQVMRLAVSLGGTETLICHPATTTHFAVPEARRRAVGIDEATLRISVGVEHVDDLLSDLAQALEHV